MPPKKGDSIRMNLIPESIVSEESCDYVTDFQYDNKDDFSQSYMDPIPNDNN